MTTERDQFCAVLTSGPLLKADAIVVLSGDGEVRYPVATGLFRQGGAPLIVVSGGLHDPPYALGAEHAAKLLISLGVAHDRIVTEGASRNTHEQAVNVLAMAKAKRWRSLILVTSAYHQYRAFLTFLRVLQSRRLDKKLRIVVAPASHVAWWKKPEGSDATRIELLTDEFEKIVRYGKQGHVASYADGLAYLKLWEGSA